MHKLQKLPRSFFNRPTLDVSRDMLGKYLVCGDKVGVINEVEAYIGQDDPACHAAKGLTKRNEVMFGPAGISYVYMIYGMYHCLNVVTEEDGFPAAVLIRGVVMDDACAKTDGPGKLCRHFEITKEHNNLDMTADFAGSSQGLYIAEKAGDSVAPEYKATPRIGISKGQDKLWRFVIC